jgi:cholinesterase
LLARLASAAAAYKVGQVVDTTSGLVEGQAASWQPEVSEYLGIPYAVPPIGNLRWTAPVMFDGNSTLKATKFSPDCAANVAAPLGSKIDYTSVADIVKGKMFRRSEQQEVTIDRNSGASG